MFLSLVPKSEDFRYFDSVENADFVPLRKDTEAARKFGRFAAFVAAVGAPHLLHRACPQREPPQGARLTAVRQSKNFSGVEFRAAGPAGDR
jgi:hypothetical protein